MALPAAVWGSALLALWPDLPVAAHFSTMYPLLMALLAAGGRALDLGSVAGLEFRPGGVLRAWYCPEVKSQSGVISGGGKTVKYLDIGDKFLTPDGTLTKEIMPDALHLSPKGYEIWAASIEPSVAKLLGEAHRLLRRGGRLVVADGFLKRPPEEMGRVAQRLVRGIKESWVIRELGQLAEFVQELECAGFGDVQVEDLRWRVAPSAMQIPLVTARFLFTELLIKRSRMTRERWSNVLGPLYGLLLALPGREMSYYLISATKN
jgi:SAM-dependent methyltransferase